MDSGSRLENVAEASPTSIDHDAAFDALVHVGGGSVSSLDRVVAQVDSSALAADSFRRGLEALGHIDLSRNEHLEVTSWSLAPPCLAEVTDGTFVLTGAWSDAARGHLQSIVEHAGGKYSYMDNVECPTSWFIESLNAAQVRALLPKVADSLPTRASPTLVQEAAARMLRALPRLSQVESRLPRAPLPGARKIERFNVSAAYWEPVQTAGSPGAYRLESAFRTVYVFRSQADIDAQTAAVGTAQLVKHLEALRLGRPLVGHYPRSQRLAVAIGSDLPGLYGRAAVLNSGRLPGISSKQRALVYHDVTAAFAAQLHHLLFS